MRCAQTVFRPSPRWLIARAQVPGGMVCAHPFYRTLHDIGGAPSLLHEALPKDEPLLPWELECHALLACLAGDGVFSTDEFRRTIENLPAHAHTDWSYYERWSAAIASLLRERGMLKAGELEKQIFGPMTATDDSARPRFVVGERVRVRSREVCETSWRSPHL